MRDPEEEGRLGSAPMTTVDGRSHRPEDGSASQRTSDSPARGIFLPLTRRMHPDLCRFVSDQFYEGRLASHPDTARQRVSGTRWPEAGAHLVEVPHAGNAQVCRPETRRSAPRSPS